MPEASRVRFVAAFAAVSLIWGSTSLAIRTALEGLPPFLLGGSRFLVAGGLLLALAGVAGGEWRELVASVPTTSSGLAWASLFVFGSSVGVSAHSWLLRVASPAAGSSYAFLNPAVAVLLGWAVAGEELHARTFGALGLVVASVGLLLLARGRAVPRASERERWLRLPVRAGATAMLAGLLVVAPAPTATAGRASLEALAHADPDVRRLAAMVLAEDLPGEPSVAAALRVRLLDPQEHWRVRSAAAGSLALAVGPEGVLARAGLELVATDPRQDWRLRATALQAWFLSDGGGDLARAAAETPERLRLVTPRGTLAVAEPDSARPFLHDRAPCLRRLAAIALRLADATGDAGGRDARSARLLEM